MNPQLVMDARDFESSFEQKWNPNAALSTDAMAINLFGPDAVKNRSTNLQGQQQVDAALGSEEERKARGIFTTADTQRLAPPSPDAGKNIPGSSDAMNGPQTGRTPLDMLTAIPGMETLGNVTLDTVGGVTDAIKSTGKLVTDIQQQVYKIAPVIEEYDRARGVDTQGPSVLENLTNALPDIPKDENTLSSTVYRPMVQWATNFVPVFNALRPLAAGAKGIAAVGTVASMVSSGTAFEGAESSLIDLVKGTPLEEIVPEFLQKDGDDGELELRLKNSISDLAASGLGIAGGTLLLQSIKGLKYGRNIITKGRQLAEATGTNPDDLAQQIKSGALQEENGVMSMNITRSPMAAEDAAQLERARAGARSIAESAGGKKGPSSVGGNFKMPKNVGDTTVVPKVSAPDRDAIIRTVWGEARGEGKEGWQGVTNVILNRVKAGRYGGKTASEVVKAKSQFEPWGKADTRKAMEALDPSSPEYQQIGDIVDQVILGDLPDNTGGATHFLGKEAQASLGRKNPKWAKGETAVVGKHSFYAPEGKVASREASAVEVPNSGMAPGGINTDILEQAARAEADIPVAERTRTIQGPKSTDLRSGGDQLVGAVDNVLNKPAKAVPDRIIGQVIQWRNYTSDEQLAGLIDQVTTGIKKKTISDEALTNAAAARGISLREIQQLGGDAEEIAVKGIATAVLEQQHARDVLMPLAKEVSLNPNKDNITEFVNQMALNRQMGRAYQRFASSAGRGLRAVQQMRNFVDNIGASFNADTVNRLRAMANDPESYRNVEALAQKLGALQNPAQANQFLRDVMRTPWDKVWDSMYFYYINALLSSPVTHAVNIAGTAGMMVYRVAEHELGAALGAGRRLATGQKLDGPAVGEMIYGQTMATRDMWRLISESTKQRSIAPLQAELAKGKQLMTSEATKIEGIRSNPISAASYFGDDAQGLGWAAKAVDGFGTVVGAPTGFLQVTDDLMKVYAYRSKQYSDAYRQALIDGYSPMQDKEAFGREINKWLQDPLPDMTLREANVREDMAAAAERFAYEATFTEELGNDVVSRMGKSMDVFAKNVPGGRYVLPFVRTPTNLLRQGLLERTPLAAFNNQLRNDFLAGGAKRDMTLAKVGMGTMAMTTTYGLVMDGRITGGGPSDPKLRQQWQDAGFKPYSVRIGDTWYEYKRLDPIGYILGAAADFGEVVNMAENYENEPMGGNETMTDYLAKVPEAIALAFTRNITSRTYTQSLADFFNLITGQEEGGILDPVQNIVSGFTPNILSFLRQSVEGDTTIEDTRPDPMDGRIQQFLDQTINKMKAKIPGMNAGPALTNPLGESLMRDPRFALGVLPLANSPADYDPVLSEAWRVRAEIRNPERNITRNGITVQLQPEEYSKLKEYIAKEPLFPGGRNTRQWMDAVVKGTVKLPVIGSYKDAPEFDGGDESIATQREILEGIYNNAKKMAVDKLLYEDSQGEGNIIRRFQKAQDNQQSLDQSPRALPMSPQGAGGTVPQLNFGVR